MWKPDPFAPEEEKSKDAAWLEGKDVEELEDLEDEISPDDPELEELRRRRIEQLKMGPVKVKYGSLEQIRANEFIAKVTNASKEGSWVVCHLYKDGIQDSDILNQVFGQLAQDYPETRFVKIVSTDCIPRYPDENVPTVLLYHEGKCKHTLVGLKEFGGRSTSPEMVAIMLNRFGCVCGGEEHHEAQVRGLLGKLLSDRVEIGGDAEDEDSDFE